jgi:hypothetical protein
MTDGVRGQVLQRLFQAIRITSHVRHIGGHGGGQRHAASLELRLVPVQNAFEQRSDGYRLSLPGCAAALDASEIEQVADDVFKPLGLVGHDPEITLARSDRPA